MFAIVGILGAGAGAGAGAVARVFANRGKHRQPGESQSAVIAEELHHAKQDLKKTEKSLEQAKKRADDLQGRTAELKETTDKLLSLRIADEARIKELQRDKTGLQERLAVLQAEASAQLEAQRAELDGLKAKVSEVLTRLMSRKISEQEATSLLNDLGCEVEYVEDAKSCERMLAEGGHQDDTWTGETRLLLEDKMRIERLVSGQMMTPRLPSHDWNSNHSRMPVVTFPQLKGPPSFRPVAVPPLRLQDAKLGNVKAAALATLNDMMAASRDQQGPAGAPPPSLSAPSVARGGGAAPPPIELLDQAHSRATLKFVYSAQGQQTGNSWIAKLPVEGLPAASGFMTSTSPPCTHRETFLEDSSHLLDSGSGLGSSATSGDISVFFGGMRH